MKRLKHKANNKKGREINLNSRKRKKRNEKRKREIKIGKNRRKYNVV